MFYMLPCFSLVGFGLRGSYVGVFSEGGHPSLEHVFFSFTWPRHAIEPVLGACARAPRHHGRGGHGRHLGIFFAQKLGCHSCLHPRGEQLRDPFLPERTRTRNAWQMQFFSLPLKKRNPKASKEDFALRGNYIAKNRPWVRAFLQRWALRIEKRGLRVRFWFPSLLNSSLLLLHTELRTQTSCVLHMYLGLGFRVSGFKGFRA